MAGYLDYSTFPAFLERHFSGSGMREDRLVGVNGKTDSGYHSIVRFFGRDAVNPEDVRVKYLDEPFSISDKRVQGFAAYVEAELRREGRIYDGPSITHLSSNEIGSTPPVIRVQQATYGQHCGCCLALDLPHPLFRDYGGTLREYYKIQAGSSLASCLGVCGFLMVQEKGQRFLLQVTRSPRLASLENTQSPSAAGTVDWNHGYANLNEMIHNSLGDEVMEELALRPGEFTVAPLAFAREIFRGERPQLFALVTTGLSMAEVASRLNGIDPEQKEFTGFRFSALRDLPSDLNHEALMNWKLIEEFLA